jgi:hypothetical protein
MENYNQSAGGSLNLEKKMIEIFECLTDRTRMRILEYLLRNGPDIYSEVVGKSISSMKILKKNELITKVGRKYKITPLGEMSYNFAKSLDIHSRLMRSGEEQMSEEPISEVYEMEILSVVGRLKIGGRPIDVSRILKQKGIKINFNKTARHLNNLANGGSVSRETLSMSHGCFSIYKITDYGRKRLADYKPLVG